MIVSFSFLSLLNSNYKDKIIEFNELGFGNWLHYDVMDGIFVENTTFDSNLVKEINSYNKLFNDVHLMIENPKSVIDNYVDAGADLITVHYETLHEDEIIEILQYIRKYNIKAGLSIKPNTSVEVLKPYLEYLDYILIMSVEPGKGGQKFIESSLNKIKYLDNLRKNYNYLIGVDGGINLDTARMVKDAGADVAIVGTYLANNLDIDTIKKIIF